MTRQQYMNWKTSSPINILYHHYVTHEKLNHSPLDPQSLIMNLQMKGWNVNAVLQNIIQEYDEKFDIITVLDKDGQLIKCI
jgi:hypothetical protein